MADMAHSSRHIVIAGGNGFLGVSLARHLRARGMRVSILSRHPPRVVGDWNVIPWDARTLGAWTAVLDGADGVVNLVGRSVDCIKTPEHRDEIWRSRIEATRILGTALLRVATPPPVWIQMSTAHIYGDPPEVVCDETAALGYGFAPDVGRAWEAEFEAGRLPGQRGVVLRTAFVIGRDLGAGGGAITRLKWLTRYGLGGRVGTGRHGFSWIHETDLNRIIERGLVDPSWQGPYNASSPDPRSQAEFMRELRRALRVSFGLPATAWMVRWGASRLLKTDPDLALSGRYVTSSRLRDAGFAFQYPELRAALEDVCRQDGQRSLPDAGVG